MTFTWQLTRPVPCFWCLPWDTSSPWYARDLSQKNCGIKKTLAYLQSWLVFPLLSPVFATALPWCKLAYLSPAWPQAFIYPAVSPCSHCCGYPGAVFCLWPAWCPWCWVLFFKIQPSNGFLGPGPKAQLPCPTAVSPVFLDHDSVVHSRRHRRNGDLRHAADFFKL